jgi:ferredoxin
MELLTRFANFFPESPPQLIFHLERCLRSRLNTNHCQRCLDSCPSKALSVDNRKIRLDIAQCTGCMACVAACPQDALASYHSLVQLLSPFQSGADAVVSCMHQVQNHPDEITIPCVGILSKQVLAAILLSDCRSVSFNVVGCSECRNYKVSNAFMLNCKQIIEDLSDIHSTTVVWVEEREQLSTSRLDRRSYLTKIREIVVDVSKQRSLSNQPAPLAESKGSRRIPLKTQLVKKMLTKLEGDSQKKIFGLLGYNLSISEDCNCCPLCKGICPTGAIKVDRSGNSKKIKFEMQDCSGCGLCVEFCKNNALSLEHLSVKFSDLSNEKIVSNFSSR